MRNLLAKFHVMSPDQRRTHTSASAREPTPVTTDPGRTLSGTAERKHRIRTQQDEPKMHIAHLVHIVSLVAIDVDLGEQREGDLTAQSQVRRAANGRSSQTLNLSSRNFSISLSDPGSWPRNWLHGNPNTKNPWDLYFSYSFTRACKRSSALLVSRVGDFHKHRYLVVGVRPASAQAKPHDNQNQNLR
jgi:hypothetical protein